MIQAIGDAFIVYGCVLLGRRAWDNMPRWNIIVTPWFVSLGVTEALWTVHQQYSSILK